MTRLLRRLAGFGRDERGVATVEFVLIAPVFLTLFLSCFEAGVLMTRQVMLDRALDITVRGVRLGQFDTVDPNRMHEELKAAMCRLAMTGPACMADLKLEMQPVDPRAWSTIDAEADCVDREDADSLPATNFVPGAENQLMLLRACEVFDPFFPTTGLAAQIMGPKGVYALVSSTAYVIEPKT